MNRWEHIIILLFVQMIASALLFGCASTPGRDRPLCPVMATAVSPDSNFIAVSTDYQEVAYFDISPFRFRSLLTPEGVKTKPKLSGIMHSPPLAFSPDGRFLIAADVGGRVVGWDVGSSSQKFSSIIEPGVVDISVFPDSRAFITAGPGAAIWSIDTGSLIDKLELPTGMKATSVSVSPDGQAILVGLSSGDIAVYSSANRKLIRAWEAHQVSVTGLAFAPDGKTLASTAGLFDPHLWKIDSELRSAETAPNVDLKTTALQSSHSTQAVASLVWLLGTVRGFQIVGAPIMGVPPGSAGLSTVNSKQCGPRIAFSPDGRYLAATAHLPMLSGDFQAFLADLKSHKTRTIAGIYGCSVAFTRDSKLLITGGLGAPVLWDVETGQKVIIGK
jgi:WD40 repeat protein